MAALDSAARRALVDRLLDGSVLAQALRALGSPETPRGWRQTQAQLSGRSAVRAQLVWRHESDSREQLVAEFAGAEVRVHTLRGDPLLPGAGVVLNESVRAEVVRYRPGKRCTLRIGAQPGGCAVFAKLLARGAASVDLAQRELYAAWRAGRLAVRVARPLACDPRVGAIWQEALPGERVVGVLLGPAGVPLAARLGEALARLHAAPLWCSARFEHAAQLARSQRVVKSICALAPELASDARRLLARLAEVPAADAVQLVPIHGSPHPEQWLDDCGQLGLVDFDRTALGAPELDLATFLAELDYEYSAGRCAEALDLAFVEAYARAGGTLDPKRLSLYRAHKHLAKAERAARALRHDGVERASTCLHRAAGWLAGV